MSKISGSGGGPSSPVAVFERLLVESPSDWLRCLRAVQGCTIAGASTLTNLPVHTILKILQHSSASRQASWGAALSLLAQVYMEHAEIVPRSQESRVGGAPCSPAQRYVLQSAGRILHERVISITERTKSGSGDGTQSVTDALLSLRSLWQTALSVHQHSRITHTFLPSPVLHGAVLPVLEAAAHVRDDVSIRTALQLEKVELTYRSLSVAEDLKLVHAASDRDGGGAVDRPIHDNDEGEVVDGQHSKTSTDVVLVDLCRPLSQRTTTDSGDDYQQRVAAVCTAILHSQNSLHEVCRVMEGTLSNSSSSTTSRQWLHHDHVVESCVKLCVRENSGRNISGSLSWGTALRLLSQTVYTDAAGQSQPAALSSVAHRSLSAAHIVSEVLCNRIRGGSDEVLDRQRKEIRSSIADLCVLLQLYCQSQLQRDSGVRTQWNRQRAIQRLHERDAQAQATIESASSAYMTSVAAGFRASMKAANDDSEFPLHDVVVAMDRLRKKYVLLARAQLQAMNDAEDVDGRSYATTTSLNGETRNNSVGDHICDAFLNFSKDSIVFVDALLDQVLTSQLEAGIEGSTSVEPLHLCLQDIHAGWCSAAIEILVSVSTAPISAGAATPSTSATAAKPAGRRKRTSNQPSLAAQETQRFATLKVWQGHAWELLRVTLRASLPCATVDPTRSAVSSGSNDLLMMLVKCMQAQHVVKPMLQLFFSEVSALPRLPATTYLESMLLQLEKDVQNIHRPGQQLLERMLDMVVNLVDVDAITQRRVAEAALREHFSASTIPATAATPLQRCTVLCLYRVILRGPATVSMDSDVSSNNREYPPQQQPSPVIEITNHTLSARWFSWEHALAVLNVSSVALVQEVLARGDVRGGREGDGATATCASKLIRALTLQVSPPQWQYALGVTETMQTMLRDAKSKMSIQSVMDNRSLAQAVRVLGPLETMSRIKQRKLRKMLDERLKVDLVDHLQALRRRHEWQMAASVYAQYGVELVHSGCGYAFAFAAAKDPALAEQLGHDMLTFGATCRSVGTALLTAAIVAAAPPATSPPPFTTTQNQENNRLATLDPALRASVGLQRGKNLIKMGIAVLPRPFTQDLTLHVTEKVARLLQNDTTRTYSETDITQFLQENGVLDEEQLAEGRRNLKRVLALALEASDASSAWLHYFNFRRIFPGCHPTHECMCHMLQLVTPSSTVPLSYEPTTSAPSHQELGLSHLIADVHGFGWTSKLLPTLVSKIMEPLLTIESSMTATGFLALSETSFLRKDTLESAVRHITAVLDHLTDKGSRSSAVLENIELLMTTTVKLRLAVQRCVELTVDECTAILNDVTRLAMVHIVPLHDRVCDSSRTTPDRKSGGAYWLSTHELWLTFIQASSSSSNVFDLVKNHIKTLSGSNVAGIGIAVSNHEWLRDTSLAALTLWFAWEDCQVKSPGYLYQQVSRLREMVEVFDSMSSSVAVKQGQDRCIEWLWLCLEAWLPFLVSACRHCWTAYDAMLVINNSGAVLRTLCTATEEEVLTTHAILRDVRWDLTNLTRTFADTIREVCCESTLEALSSTMGENPASIRDRVHTARDAMMWFLSYAQAHMINTQKVQQVRRSIVAAVFRLDSCVAISDQGAKGATVVRRTTTVNSTNSAEMLTLTECVAIGDCCSSEMPEYSDDELRFGTMLQRLRQSLPHDRKSWNLEARSRQVICIVHALIMFVEGSLNQLHNKNVEELREFLREVWNGATRAQTPTQTQHIEERHDEDSEAVEALVEWVCLRFGCTETSQSICPTRTLELLLRHGSVIARFESQRTALVVSSSFMICDPGAVVHARDVQTYMVSHFVKHFVGSIAQEDAARLLHVLSGVDMKRWDLALTLALQCAQPQQPLGDQPTRSDERIHEITETLCEQLLLNFVSWPPLLAAQLITRVASSNVNSETRGALWVSLYSNVAKDLSTDAVLVEREAAEVLSSIAQVRNRFNVIASDSIVNNFDTSENGNNAGTRTVKNGSALIFRAVEAAIMSKICSGLSRNNAHAVADEVYERLSSPVAASQLLRSISEEKSFSLFRFLSPQSCRTVVTLLAHSRTAFFDLIAGVQASTIASVFAPHVLAAFFVDSPTKDNHEGLRMRTLRYHTALFNTAVAVKGIEVLGASHIAQLRLPQGPQLEQDRISALPAKVHAEPERITDAAVSDTISVCLHTFYAAPVDDLPDAFTKMLQEVLTIPNMYGNPIRSWKSCCHQVKQLFDVLVCRFGKEGFVHSLSSSSDQSEIAEVMLRSKLAVSLIERWYRSIGKLQLCMTNLNANADEMRFTLANVGSITLFVFMLDAADIESVEIAMASYLVACNWTNETTERFSSSGMHLPDKALVKLRRWCSPRFTTLTKQKVGSVLRAKLLDDEQRASFERQLVEWKYHVDLISSESLFAACAAMIDFIGDTLNPVGCLFQGTMYDAISVIRRASVARLWEGMLEIMQRMMVAQRSTRNPSKALHAMLLRILSISFIMDPYHRSRARENVPTVGQVHQRDGHTTPLVLATGSSLRHLLQLAAAFDRIENKEETMSRGLLDTVLETERAWAAAAPQDQSYRPAHDVQIVLECLLNALQKNRDLVTPKGWTNDRALLLDHSYTTLLDFLRLAEDACGKDIEESSITRAKRSPSSTVECFNIGSPIVQRLLTETFGEDTLRVLYRIHIAHQVKVEHQMLASTNISRSPVALKQLSAVAWRTLTSQDVANVQQLMYTVPSTVAFSASGLLYFLSGRWKRAPKDELRTIVSEYRRLLRLQIGRTRGLPERQQEELSPQKFAQRCTSTLFQEREGSVKTTISMLDPCAPQDEGGVIEAVDMLRLVGDRFTALRIVNAVLPFSMVSSTLLSCAAVVAAEEISSVASQEKAIPTVAMGLALLVVSSIVTSYQSVQLDDTGLEALAVIFGILHTLSSDVQVQSCALALTPLYRRPEQLQRVVRRMNMILEDGVWNRVLHGLGSMPNLLRHSLLQRLPLSVKQNISQKALIVLRQDRQSISLDTPVLTIYLSMCKIMDAAAPTQVSEGEGSMTLALVDVVRGAPWRRAVNVLEHIFTHGGGGTNATGLSAGTLERRLLFAVLKQAASAETAKNSELGTPAKALWTQGRRFITRACLELHIPRLLQQPCRSSETLDNAATMLRFLASAQTKHLWRLALPLAAIANEMQRRALNESHRVEDVRYLSLDYLLNSCGAAEHMVADSVFEAYLRLFEGQQNNPVKLLKQSIRVLCRHPTISWEAALGAWSRQFPGEPVPTKIAISLLQNMKKRRRYDTLLQVAEAVSASVADPTVHALVVEAATVAAPRAVNEILHCIRGEIASRSVLEVLHDQHRVRFSEAAAALRQCMLRGSWEESLMLLMNTPTLASNARMSDAVFALSSKHHGVTALQMMEHLLDRTPTDELGQGLLDRMSRHRALLIALLKCYTDESSYRETAQQTFSRSCVWALRSLLLVAHDETSTSDSSAGITEDDKRDIVNVVAAVVHWLPKAETPKLESQKPDENGLPMWNLLGELHRGCLQREAHYGKDTHIADDERKSLWVHVPEVLLSMASVALATRPEVVRPLLACFQRLSRLHSTLTASPDNIQATAEFAASYVKYRHSFYVTAAEGSSNSRRASSPTQLAEVIAFSPNAQVHWIDALAAVTAAEDYMKISDDGSHGVSSGAATNNAAFVNRCLQLAAQGSLYVEVVQRAFHYFIDSPLRVRDNRDAFQQHVECMPQYMHYLQQCSRCVSTTSREDISLPSLKQRKINSEALHQLQHLTLKGDQGTGIPPMALISLLHVIRPVISHESISSGGDVAPLLTLESETGWWCDAPTLWGLVKTTTEQMLLSGATMSRSVRAQLATSILAVFGRLTLQPLASEMNEEVRHADSDRLFWTEAFEHIRTTVQNLLGDDIMLPTGVDTLAPSDIVLQGRSLLAMMDRYLDLHLQASLMTRDQCKAFYEAFVHSLHAPAILLSGLLQGEDVKAILKTWSIRLGGKEWKSMYDASTAGSSNWITSALPTTSTEESVDVSNAEREQILQLIEGASTWEAASLAFSSMLPMSVGGMSVANDQQGGRTHTSHFEALLKRMASQANQSAVDPSLVFNVHLKLLSHSLQPTTAIIEASLQVLLASDSAQLASEYLRSLDILRVPTTPEDANQSNTSTRSTSSSVHRLAVPYAFRTQTLTLVGNVVKLLVKRSTSLSEKSTTSPLQPEMTEDGTSMAVFDSLQSQENMARFLTWLCAFPRFAPIPEPVFKDLIAFLLLMLPAAPTTPAGKDSRAASTSETVQSALCRLVCRALQSGTPLQHLDDARWLNIIQRLGSEVHRSVQDAASPLADPLVEKCIQAILSSAAYRPAFQASLAAEWAASSTVSLVDATANCAASPLTALQASLQTYRSCIYEASSDESRALAATIPNPSLGGSWRNACQLVTSFTQHADECDLDAGTSLYPVLHKATDTLLSEGRWYEALRCADQVTLFHRASQRDDYLVISLLLFLAKEPHKQDQARQMLAAVRKESDKNEGASPLIRQATAVVSSLL